MVIELNFFTTVHKISIQIYSTYVLSPLYFHKGKSEVFLGSIPQDQALQARLVYET